jgi:hypothetical protein
MINVSDIVVEYDNPECANRTISVTADFRYDNVWQVDSARSENHDEDWSLVSGRTFRDGYEGIMYESEAGGRATIWIPVEPMDLILVEDTGLREETIALIKSKYESKET